MDPDGPKTYESFGSGSGTLLWQHPPPFLKVSFFSFPPFPFHSVFLYLPIQYWILRSLQPYDQINALWSSWSLSFPAQGMHGAHPALDSTGVADPGCLSRIRIFPIPDPHQRIKYLTQKKWFPSSRKYDPGCSSRTWNPDPDPDFLPIPDPGVKKAPDPGSTTMDSTQPARPTAKTMYSGFWSLRFPAQGMHGAHTPLDSTQPAHPTAKTMYSGSSDLWVPLLKVCDAPPPPRHWILRSLPTPRTILLFSGSADLWVSLL